MALLCWSNAPAHGAPNLSVILTPGAPLTNEMLTATAGVSGMSSEGLVYNYNFKVGGTSVQNGPARTLDLSQTGNGDVGQTVSVQVAASGGVATVAPATASVTVANSEPTLNNITYGTSVNIPFSQQLEGKDDDNEALTYSLAVGTLPTGLTLSTSGLISGTPTTVGRSDFSVSVTDGKATKTAKFVIIVSSNSDGVGPTIVTRDPLAQTYTRDQLASLIYRGTIKDTAQGNITPSGVSQLLFQLRRPSDSTAYSGPNDGFTTNLNRGYYSALLQAPVPNDTSGTRDFRRTFSTFIPPASMLTPDDYSLVIASQDVAGNWSIEVVPLTIVAPPAAPTALTATAGDGQVTLLWNAVSDARSYRVYRSTTSGNYDFSDPVAIVTGTSATHTGLTNGTTYFYVVRSVNRIGESPDSNEASATPVVAVRQLDLQIQALTNPASALVGADIYYPDDQPQGQTASYSIPDRTSATFLLRVKNNGNVADSFRLSGRGDTPGWTVRYFDASVGGTDISAMVKGNNYVNSLSVASSRDYRVEVTPDASVAQNTSKDVPVSVVSEQDSAGAMDRVLARSIQASAPPPPPAPTFRADGAVRLASETAYIGTDIYSSSAGTSQTVSGTASGAVAAVYNWKIRNTSSSADSFQLTLPALDANWSVRLYDALDGGTDITTAAQSASGYATATLSPQQAVELRLEVQPQNGVTGSKATTLTATSAGDTSGNTRDVCLASTLVGSVTANPVVSFSGATRASAGGVDNALHQLNLTLHASDGGANLVNTPLVLSFENNVGHNYGTTAAPDVRHKAKIYDPNEPIIANRWKESVTRTTDANGDIPIAVLSSDVISQPRLIARVGTSIAGGVACEFAAATSKRGFPDPVVGTYNGWQNDDFGWTCNFGAAENSGDTAVVKLYLKYLNSSGNYTPVAGHQVLIKVGRLNTLGGSAIFDSNEAGRYVLFLNGTAESTSAIVTTDQDGVAQVTLKIKADVSALTSLEFTARNLTQWVK